MKRLDYTYALVKALYDQCEDYIDCFWPFAIRIIPADRSIEYELIQRRMEEEFELKTPLHVLRTILSRAKKKGYIEQERDARLYKLTEKGLNYLDTLESEKDVERRINALTEDIEQFFTKRNISLSLEETHDLLSSFIRRNIEPIINFINPCVESEDVFITKLSVHDKYIIEYIQSAEDQKPEYYKTFEDMALGSIISVILNAEDTSEMMEVTSRRFKNCTAFLDTNIVFSVLDITRPELHEPAIELFNLAKKQGIEIKVFNFTVDEICRVVNGYLIEMDHYPSTINVASIYSSLKRKGWKSTTVKEFIMNIENILEKNGIAIEGVANIDLDKYMPSNKELRALMGKYKPWQSTFYQNHDLAALENIMEIRKKPMRRIEDSKAFFLTSDARFSTLNLLEMGHKENGTVCEIILDRLLTNLLWLKDPCANLSIKSIIAAHSRGIFIQKRVWNTFYEVIKVMKQRGEVEDEAISTLFYHSYIEDVLREVDETKVHEITPEFVLEKIEEASKLPEEEFQRKIAEKEREFLESLAKEVSTTQREKDKEWLEKWEGIRGNVSEVSHKFAKKRVRSLCVSSLIIFVLPSIGLLATKEWLAFAIYTGTITFLTALVQFFIRSFVRDCWEKLENKWYTKMYNGKIKEAGLDEFQ